MKADELKDGILTVLGDTETAKICVQLVDALLRIAPQEGEFLTFTSIQLLIDRKAIDQPLVQAVQFLTSSQFHLLEAHGQFVDDDGDEYTLEADDFKEVLINGSLVHPNTGDLLENARDLVVPFFVLAPPKSLELHQ